MKSASGDGWVDQVTLIGGWVGSGVSMRRFTRHLDTRGLKIRFGSVPLLDD